MRKLLQRCRRHGISISQKKFVFAKQEVKYVGFIDSGRLHQADPDKIKAIRDFPQPTNLTELRSFMGLVNQLSGFSKDLMEAALPLRPLLKSKRVFQWLKEHTKSFEKAKKIIAGFPIRDHSILVYQQFSKLMHQE